MIEESGRGGHAVLRATSSVVTFAAVCAIGAVFVIDALLRGRWELAARVVGVFLFVLWAAWVFLVRMSIRVDETSVTARNLLRVTHVPWGRVVAIERHAQLRVVLDDGGRVECWGSPFPPRTGFSRSPAGRTSGLGDTPLGRRPLSTRGGDKALETLRGAWQAGVKTDGTVRRGWDVAALVAGGICAVCALIALLV